MCNKICGIYKITSPSGKIYIGQSVHIPSRISRYKKLQCNEQPRILNSLKKYGIDTHQFEIIELCEVEELNERERFYQDLYDATGRHGMNCKLTTTNDRSGCLSDEYKMKISKTLQGRKKSEETKMRMKKAQNGKIVSEKTRKIMSEAHKGTPAWNKGVKHSEKTINKMRESHKGVTAWNKGKQLTEQDRLNKSIAAKKRWAEKKLLTYLNSNEENSSSF